MALHSSPYRLCYRALAALSTISLASAWSLADNCQGADVARVEASMGIALDMLNYAIARAAQNTKFPRQGTLIQDLLGATDENDATVLQLVRTTMGNAVSVASGPSPPAIPNPPGIGLVIHCSDSHLSNTSPATGLYHDNSDGRRAQVRLPPRTGTAQNACGNVLRAFEYPFTDKNGGTGHAIVLCSDGPRGALKAARSDEITELRTRNIDIRKPPTGPLGMDLLGGFLSYMLVHEMMHAGGELQFPAKLPSGSGELYSYRNIAGRGFGVDAAGTNPPSANDRQHNADSMALTAAGWYLPIWSWVNGMATLITDKSQRPPLQNPT